MDTIVNYYLRVENWIKEIKVPPPESFTDFTVHTYQSVASFITTHGMAVTALALGVGLVTVSCFLLKSLYDKKVLSAKLDNAEFWKKVNLDASNIWRGRFEESQEELDKLTEDSYKRINELKIINNDIKVSYYAAASKLEELQEENSNLLESEFELKEQVSDLEDQVSALEDQVTDLEDQVQCARDDEAYEESRAEDLFEELTDLRNMYDNQNDELTDLHKKFSNIQAANEAYAELVVELKAA